MVGIDTNILVRFFICDDEFQSRKATAFVDSLSAEEQGFVSLIVVTELAWVLQYVFQLSRTQVIDILAKLAAGVAEHAGCTGTVTFDRKTSKVPGMIRIR
jgi:predicted nucleic-acid-binding protein